MEGVAEPGPTPLVSLEQAVALAKHHTWSRVGFTIGVVTYGLATLWVQRESGLSDGVWLALFVAGVSIISAFGVRWHASAKATMASASVVDGAGNVLGRADHVARREIERRVINLWRIGHKTAHPGQVMGDDAPITTHGPRQRRRAPRRRR